MQFRNLDPLFISYDRPTILKNPETGTEVKVVDVDLDDQRCVLVGTKDTSYVNALSFSFLSDFEVIDTGRDEEEELVSPLSTFEMELLTDFPWENSEGPKAS